MSVLIKGVEMPVSCLVCPFSHPYGYGEDEYWCDITDKRLGNYYGDRRAKWYNERREFCPLVEVDETRQYIAERDEVTE